MSKDAGSDIETVLEKMEARIPNITQRISQDHWQQHATSTYR